MQSIVQYNDWLNEEVSLKLNLRSYFSLKQDSEKSFLKYLKANIEMRFLYISNNILPILSNDRPLP